MTVHSNPLDVRPQIVLGRAVREMRARRAMSQERLGQLSGLHRNYVGAIERGEINPTFTTLLKLEDGLALPLAEVFELYARRQQETIVEANRQRAAR